MSEINRRRKKSLGLNCGEEEMRVKWKESGKAISDITETKKPIKYLSLSPESMAQ